MPTLAVEAVAVLRGGRVVLRVERLEAYAGQVLAVIGPNGAGKSTLLQVMALLERPEAGRVLLGGVDVGRHRLAARRRMAAVFQEPLLLDTSVRANVETGLALRGARRRVRQERAARWMARFGISGLAERRARTLSGGEAQRTSLARAFALEPEVLLLDEPFAALDAPTREELLRDLHRVLRETGVCAVLVTHDREEALRLADRAAVLIGGEVRQVGSTAEVFGTPVDPQVAAFVGVETILPARLKGLEGGISLVEIGGVTVQAAANGVATPEVLLCVRPEDVMLGGEAAVVPGSVRNRLTGRVRRITPVGSQVRVEVDCGFPVVALITRRSLEELALEVDAPVLVAFKASAVHLIPR